MPAGLQKCPGCGEMVYVIFNHECCKNCRPDIAKSLKEINKEYAEIDKKKLRNT